ncbi:DUF4255 domain-containing protein [Nocardioides litoris]|uniref:DUF4255 domain-containing protein n=1 Tax=Nocardioides litoris TaxID=1926648 RepID=UPI001120C246|nr:DUF4255 domain-containing protein [Nocardioides litoris]
MRRWACKTPGVFIANVDAGLERMVRERLPLPEDIGDVVFDAPTSTWSAQLSRITVSMFLYDVRRSTQPSRSATVRVDGDGRGLRRRPQPMVELAYLVSAWAGSPRDEHQLLGDLVSMVSGTDTVPPEMFVTAPTTSVTLATGDDRNLGRELWSGIGGGLKASVSLVATVGADAFDWQEQAPPVERIAAMADRMTPDDPRRLGAGGR